MPDITKRLVLNKLDYFETHLSIINCVLPRKMTPMEIKVVAAFMSLEGDIVEYRFSGPGRKIVTDRLDISTSGLSNYLNSLKNKGFLKETEQGITILPLLIPSGDEQMYIFKLVNNDKVAINNNGVTTQ